MAIKGFKMKKTLKEVQIMCVPAHIRHCEGVIVEVVTCQPERKVMFNLMAELKEKHGYNVYSLRHKSNDWSEPHYITEKHILIDRFGWFITKDKMKFNDILQEITLGVYNAKYYDEENGERIEEPCYGYCKQIDILDYLYDTKN